MQAKHLVWLTIMVLLSAQPFRVLARDANTDSVDVKIPTTRSEAENSVAVSPLNSKVLLVSNIANASDLGRTFGVTSWISHDAGKTWLTTDSLVLSPSRGDPAVAIGRNGGTNGRYFINHLDNGPPDYDLGIHYKDTTGGTSWTHQLVDAGGEGSTDDKCHLAINNNTTGSFTNYLISAWHDLDGSAESGVYAKYSDANGASWSDLVTIAGSVSAKEQRNVNLQWGRPDSSLAFACWSIASTGQPIAKLLFKSSADGGATWRPSTAREITTVAGFKTLTGKSAAWATGGAPAMAVDGNSGDIYLVYAAKTSGQADVWYRKSSDNGVTWSSAALVHDTNNKDQWHPWIAWDDCTGAMVVVYFDSRDFSGNDNVHTYLSVKYPADSTWSDFRVSDSSWDGDSGGFAGDYIGVAAKDGIAFPIWSDDREVNNLFKPYVSPIYLWGVTQSSVSVSTVNEPSLQLTFTATWDTNLPAAGADYIVLKSPTNVTYTGTATPSGGGTSHNVSKTCTCEVGHWKYIVKSTRTGFTSRGSDEKTVNITACVE